MEFIKRPFVSKNSSPISEIVNYIPAEIVGAYVAISGLFAAGGKADFFLPVFITLIVITPVWTYFAVIDNPTPVANAQPKKSALFHAAIATISFAVWVYALNDILFHTWVTKYHSSFYDATIGSIVLIVYTTLIVPLLRRIILGKK